MKATVERRLKGLLKEAIVEVLQERRDLLQDAVEESLEDAALLRAIRDGEKTRRVDRKQVFKLLERKA